MELCVNKQKSKYKAKKFLCLHELREKCLRYDEPFDMCHG